MPRPRTFDENQIIHIATQAFWNYGYNATSMDDLVRHTGLNKSSLYNAFGDKRKLFDLCLEYYATLMCERMERELQINDPIQALQSVFRMFLTSQADSSINCGCFVSNIASELGPHDPNIAKRVLDYIEDSRKMLSRTIQLGIDANIFHDHLDPVMAAHSLIACLLGGLVLHKTGYEESEITGIFDNAVQQLCTDTFSLTDTGSQLI